MVEVWKAVWPEVASVVSVWERSEGALDLRFVFQSRHQLSFHLLSRKVPFFFG